MMKVMWVLVTCLLILACKREGDFNAALRYLKCTSISSQIRWICCVHEFEAVSHHHHQTVEYVYMKRHLLGKLVGKMTVICIHLWESFNANQELGHKTWKANFDILVSPLNWTNKVLIHSITTSKRV